VSTASRNIRHLRRKYQFTQEEMARKLGIKRSLLGAYEEDRANPRLDVLVKAAEIFNMSVDQLVSDSLVDAPSESTANQPSSAAPRSSESPSRANLSQTSTYRRHKISESLDKGKASSLQSVQALRLVPAEEFDRYFYEAVDEAYLEKLPLLRIPGLPPSNMPYRAFEVEDDSMSPVEKGAVVVARQEEKIQQIKDGKLYVLVTRTDGVIFRRVYNHIRKSGELLLEALNPAFTQQQLSVMGREVEAWEVLLYISSQLPSSASPESSAAMDLPQLTRLVLDLQQEVMRLKGQL
jgi:transcriptional regulator with XRE-family HTH domain